MTKKVTLKYLDIPFTIRSLTSWEYNNIMKRSMNMLGVINTVDMVNAVLFACVLSPKYDTAEKLLETLIPGQFDELMNHVLELNGIENDNEKVEK